MRDTPASANTTDVSIRQELTPLPADIECFARDLGIRGRARATITQRPCTIAGFYKYAVEQELLDHSPGGSCPPPAPGLRIAGHRPGPQ